jgi:hypothetical protein
MLKSVLHATLNPTHSVARAHTHTHTATHKYREEKIPQYEGEWEKITVNPPFITEQPVEDNSSCGVIICAIMDCIGSVYFILF